MHKLQLIRDAKRVCPDVVIMLGEDLKPFRDASKDLYAFLRGFVADWGNQAEKLGLDEVCRVIVAIYPFNMSFSCFVCFSGAV